MSHVLPSYIIDEITYIDYRLVTDQTYSFRTNTCFRHICNIHDTLTVSLQSEVVYHVGVQSFHERKINRQAHACVSVISDYLEHKETANKTKFKSL